MTTPIEIRFTDLSLDALADVPGKIVVFADPEAPLDRAAKKVSTLTRKSVARLVESEEFARLKDGDARVIAWPSGLQAEAVIVVKLGRKAEVAEARKAGAAIAKLQGEADLTILGAGLRRIDEVALGLALRGYAFDAHKSKPAPARGMVRIMVTNPDALSAGVRAQAALAEGVFFTRDLVNEPANVLTTVDFAARLAAMQEIGLEVEILEEEQLRELGMRCLLSVGQGSDSPSKVVVMHWNGGDKDTPPLALVGKGVVFDTGGISLKPALGMEEMTTDMGGAGVVAGVMRTLALRKAKANVVGLVGLVENMPSGSATRPGDVIKSMKGDRIEVVNTDAEGRMVLADVLWYAQDRFNPSGIIDLATLTGAMVVALGGERAGLFSNSDELCGQIEKAAEAEAEGVWRMPIDKAYDKLIESRTGDIKNSGGRDAGSITAARFLAHFIREDMPWCHIDIAGVASGKKETTLAPAGATGWGVATLNRLIADRYEG